MELPDTHQPRYRAKSFICPHCRVHAAMYWDDLWLIGGGGSMTETLYVQGQCNHCGKTTLWEALMQRGSYDEDSLKVAPGGICIYPRTVTAPPAHSDLPEACKADFEEARQIAVVSPRGAAALLRLVVQKLCKALGQPGKNINDDIKALVKAGLPVDAQQALDILRVTGNNAVHPGEMDVDGNPDLVSASFELINFIVDQQITQKKRVANLFAKLPAGAKDAIAKRDSTP